MLTEKDDACWHCDQWIFTLIFWDKKTIGKNAQAEQDPVVSSKLISQVQKLNP